jgi:hypothetical protein
MEHFVSDVRVAVRNEAWYSALGLALALPDICGFVESPPPVRSQARYVTWFDREVGPRYTQSTQGDGGLFLTGRDCYALRCAFLHQGDFDVTDQHARLALERFHFVVPPPGWTVHCNRFNDSLQLQVSNFCEDICAGVEAWLPRARADAGQKQRLLELATIQVAIAGQPFSI